MVVKENLEENGLIGYPRICPTCKCRSVYYRTKGIQTFICISCWDRGFDIKELFKEEQI